MKRKLWILVLVVPVVAGGLSYYFLHREQRAGMSMIRLLPPELDLYAVADLSGAGVRSAIAKLAANSSGRPHDAEYERFIRESGFRYERDLRQIAIGKSGADWVGVVRVDIDRPRLIHYLESEGAQKSAARGHAVYSFGHARVFRLVFFDNKSSNAMVGFTAGGDEAQLAQLAARYSGSGDSAATELEQMNASVHIPPSSKLWLAAKPEKLWTSGEAQLGALAIGTGLLRGSRMLYASIQPGVTQLNFRVEDVCDNPESAQRIANSLRGLLALLRAAPSGKPKSAAQPQSLLEGISIEEAQQSVVLQWQWDENALQLLKSELQ